MKTVEFKLTGKEINDSLKIESDKKQLIVEQKQKQLVVDIIQFNEESKLQTFELNKKIAEYNANNTTQIETNYTNCIRVVDNEVVNENFYIVNNKYCGVIIDYSGKITVKALNSFNRTNYRATRLDLDKVIDTIIYFTLDVKGNN